MDARDRLRLYLEQRRELGESDLVLDQLPVADVLAMLGAKSPPATGSRAPADADAAGKAGAPADSARAGRREPADGTGGADASASPPRPADPAPPPPPAPRFDTASAMDGDWRAALRASGASAPGSASRPAAPGEPPASKAPADVQGASSSDDADRPVARSSGAPSGASSDSSSAARKTDGEGAAGSAPPAAPAWLAALEVPFGLTVGEARLSSGGGASAAPGTLAEIADAVAGCTACPLHASAMNPVPGEGDPDADFVCVGEAPGQHEDESGRPFVGAAGQLLTKILAAIELSREQVFICNVLKHRPPGNRNPAPAEVQACRPFLEQQLALVQPRVILALGTFAAQTLLGTTQSLGALRGQVHRYHGVPLIVTYHPAALLRNEAWKRPTWEDVQLARRVLDASRAADPA